MSPGIQHKNSRVVLLNQFRIRDKVVSVPESNSELSDYIESLVLQGFSDRCLAPQHLIKDLSLRNEDKVLLSSVGLPSGPGLSQGFGFDGESPFMSRLSESPDFESFGKTVIHSDKQFVIGTNSADGPICLGSDGTLTTYFEGIPPLPYASSLKQMLQFFYLWSLAMDIAYPIPDDDEIQEYSSCSVSLGLPRDVLRSLEAIYLALGSEHKVKRDFWTFVLWQSEPHSSTERRSIECFLQNPKSDLGN